MSTSKRKKQKGGSGQPSPVAAAVADAPIFDGADGTLIAEVVVGTYQEFVLGYRLLKKTTEDGQEFTLKQSFTNHSHCGSIRALGTVGKYIVSGSTDEVVRIINLTTRVEHGSLQQQNGTITCLAGFEGSHVFSGSEDGTLCVWRTGNWLCEKTLKGHQSGIIGVAIHPTGKLALSIAKDKSLRTWNLVKGRCGYVTNLHAIADIVAWSTEGTLYAIGISNRVDVYSVQSAQVIYSIPFGKRITSICFASEKIMFIGGDQEEVQVHNIKKGKQILSFAAHKNRVKDMTFLSNPKLLITASNDGFIKIWDFCGKFSKAPTLLTEINTSCRITCLTVWKPEELPSKSSSAPVVEEAKPIKLKEKRHISEEATNVPASTKKKNQKS